MTPSRPGARRRTTQIATALGSTLALLVLFVLLAARPPAAAAQGAEPAYDPEVFSGLEFRHLGPFRGGRSTAVTGVPGKPNTWYMGSTGGGLWRSEDNGETWTNVSDGFFEVAPVGAVAVAPSDASVIYVGTGSACIRGNVSTGRGVYRSTDGGETWSFVGLPEAGQIGRIEVHPDDPDVAWLAALGHPFGENDQRGVFRTTDGGDSWEKVLFLNDSTGVADLAMNPENPQELYAAAWSGERKPWEIRSGTRWEDGAGLWKSTDGGDSWTHLEGGLPKGLVGRVGVTVSPADPDRVWAILEAEPEGGVYRSDDAGETWTRVNDENKLRQRAYYYSHLRADPQDPNTVYALNTDFYRSVDGGKTFESIAVPHGDVHDLWITPEEPDRMIVANDGGGQVSVNGGESWSTMYNQPTAELYQVTVDDGFPYRVYGAQQDNTTISVPAWTSSNTLHPKQHWQNAGGCETGPVALHPEHPEVTFAGCYGGVIDRYRHDVDQRRNMLLYPQLQLGQAPRNLRYRFQWVSPMVVSPHDPQTVYHASNRVHRSRDLGTSWETISPDLTTDDESQQGFSGPINHEGTGVEVYNTVFSFRVSPHSAETLWAGSDDGLVHISRDDGGSWTEITPEGMPEGGTVSHIEVSPHRAGKAYLAVYRYREDDFAPHVFRTTDFGESWTRLTDGENGIPGDHPVRVVREDPEREGLLYAGTEFGLFVSFDDGRRWQSLRLAHDGHQDGDLPVTPVTDLEVRHGDLQLSTQGRGFWALDDVGPLRQMADSLAGRDAVLFTPGTARRVNDRGPSGDRAPDPRPHGALLHYYLSDAPGEDTRIEILDDAGSVVHAFTADSAEADRPGRSALPEEAGGNRVVWDLMYPGPDRPEDVVIWGYTGGVKAPPGTYRARLVRDGQNVATRSFRVEADPRLQEITQADYEAQYELGTTIRDSLDAVWDALRRIRDVKSQVASASERAGRVLEGAVADSARRMADSLESRLSAVEAELTQVKSESGQDPIRFPPQIDNQYVSLYAYVTGIDGYRYGGAEGRPTEGARVRFEDLNEEWAGYRSRLARILDRDLAALNRLLRDQGVPAVVTAGGR